MTNLLSASTPCIVGARYSKEQKRNHHRAKGNVKIFLTVIKPNKIQSRVSVHTFVDSGSLRSIKYCLHLSS